MTQNHYASALTSYQAGDLTEAERQVTLLLSQQPGHLEGQALAAYTASGLGRHREAMERAEAVIKKSSGSSDGWFVKARVALWAGQLEEALFAAQEAVRKSPDDPDYPSQFAQELAKLGLTLQAVSWFELAAKAARLDPIHRRNYALALSEAGQEVEAVKEWKRIAKVWPDDMTCWLNLAKLSLAHGKIQDAVQYAEKASNLDITSSTASLLLALSLAEDGRTEEALLPIQKTLEAEPENAVAHAALGFWQQERGEFASAQKHLEQAIRLNPTHGFAYYNLFRARKAREEDQPQLDQMMELASSPSITIRDKGYLHYALGKAFEDLKRYELSMSQYDMGNHCAYQQWLAHKPWDKEEYSREFDATIRYFDESRLNQLQQGGAASTQPIIIVGMIRSGTSLLEQILSSHPEVTGAGELPFWHENQGRAWQGEAIVADSLPGLAEEYLTKLTSLSGGAKRVTDKLPHNYAMLGLIHSALPKAKIIHVKRSPLDNALSVYTTAYQRPPVFAHDKENIVFAYREYLRIMDHWRRVISPESLIEIQYEDLVADKEGMTRRLMDFCDLAWSSDLLNHTENKRSVRTPSLWQVRQPVYKTSIERWRNFEPWLGRLRDLSSPSI